MSVDHVLYAFPSAIFELCQRRGFRLEAYRGTLITGKRSLKHRTLYTVCRPFLQPEFYCTTFIYECVRV